MVTGAASGIGLGIARAFAAQGARLALVDRERGAAGRGCRARLPGCARLRLRPRRRRRCRSARARAVRDRFPELRVLVNNAGAEYPTPLDDAPPDAMKRWASLLDNNVTSMARLTRALLPSMPTGCEHHQPGLDLGPVRRRRLLRLRGEQARHRRPHACAGLGARAARHSRQRRLPRLDPHRRRAAIAHGHGHGFGTKRRRGTARHPRAAGRCRPSSNPPTSRASICSSPATMRGPSPASRWSRATGS